MDASGPGMYVRGPQRRNGWGLVSSTADRAGQGSRRTGGYKAVSRGVGPKRCVHVVGDLDCSPDPDRPQSAHDVRVADELEGGGDVDGLIGKGLVAEVCVTGRQE